MAQKIRIRLKAYDHRVLDQAADKIVDILDPNPRVVDALMRLSLPAGVSIEIKS